MKRKTFIAGLFITGISLVITAISAFIWNGLLEQPAGLFGLFAAIFLAVTGLLGGTIREWANNLFGKKGNETEIKRQINVGDNTTNIVTDKFVQNIFESTPEQEVPTITSFTIPLPVQDFTGREEELRLLKSEFERGAIVVGISGGGGIGKTELARKLADEMKSQYSIQLSIDLLGTSENPMSSEEAIRRLLAPFYPSQRLPDEPDQLKGLYQEIFSTQKALLLLDNVASPNQVRTLVPSKTSIALFTSRQHFSLTEFGLKEPLRLNTFSTANSQKLLRTTSSKIERALDEHVEKLAGLCGYLPLALRVAASILNDRPDWSLETLLQKLADERTRLQQLKRLNDVDLDVEATIGLSYQLLPNQDKKYFRMLSAFSGLFWKEPIMVVLGLDHEEVDRILGTFILRSLVNSYPIEFREVGKNEPIDGYIYAFHDLTRLFSLKCLKENNEETKLASARHASFFLSQAGLADHEYLLGEEHITNSLNLFRVIWPDLLIAWHRMQPNQKEWPRPEFADDWLVSFPNVCASIFEIQISALQRARFLQVALEAFKTRKVEPSKSEEQSRPGEVAIPLEIAYLNNLGDDFVSAGEMQQAISVLEDALIKLDAHDSISESARKYIMVSISSNMGNAFFGLRNLRKAIEWWGQSLDISLEIHNKNGECRAVGNLANAYSESGDLLAAIGHYERQLVLAQETGSKRDEGDALGNMGIIFGNWGEYHKSKLLHEQARVIAHERGDIRREGIQIACLGSCYGDLKDLHKAIEFYKDALPYHQRAGDRQMEGHTLMNLGTAYFCLGEKEEAKQEWQYAFVVYQGINDPRASWIQGWLNRMDFDPQEISTPRLYLPELIKSVVDAAQNKKPEAAFYFEIISKLLHTSDITLQFQELLGVLQKILIGIKLPNLSRLPKELANIINGELAK